MDTGLKEQPQNEFGPVPARTHPADALSGGFQPKQDLHKRQQDKT